MKRHLHSDFFKNPFLHTEHNFLDPLHDSKISIGCTSDKVSNSPLTLQFFKQERSNLQGREGVRETTPGFNRNDQKSMDPQTTIINDNCILNN